MIRSIHPLYMLGLMVALLLSVIWKNSTIENEIVNELSERANAKVMAKRIVELKKVMQTGSKGEIERFVDGVVFSNAELTHKVKGDRYIIDAKNMNAGQLQSFLNRILNMSVNILQMKVERKDDKTVSLYMEIGL